MKHVPIKLKIVPNPSSIENLKGFLIISKIASLHAAQKFFPYNAIYNINK